MPAKIYTVLSLDKLELAINLGWEKKERKRKQHVLLDIMIHFPVQPKACQSDQLEHTLCYEQLIAKLRKEIANRQFCLIEHLSAEVYTLLKNNLPKKTKLAIRITKYPRIKGLAGASFCYGDSNYAM